MMALCMPSQQYSDSHAGLTTCSTCIRTIGAERTKGQQLNPARQAGADAMLYLFFLCKP